MEASSARCQYCQGRSIILETSTSSGLRSLLSWERITQILVKKLLKRFPKQDLACIVFFLNLKLTLFFRLSFILVVRAKKVGFQKMYPLDFVLKHANPNPNEYGL